jgi:GAF domain-containing protein
VATSILVSGPVDSSPRLPASLVHYAHRTKERVILSDATADAGKVSGDDYFAHGGHKSVLCLPILRQAEVVGLLYLENNLLVGAFTPDRLVALELLATQAAISLQNALLLAKERAAGPASRALCRRHSGNLRQRRTREAHPRARDADGLGGAARGAFTIELPCAASPSA